VLFEPLQRNQPVGIVAMLPDHIMIMPETNALLETHAVPLEESTLPEAPGATEENPVPPELPIMTLLAVTVAEPVPPDVTAKGVVRAKEAALNAAK
jgi:hypothetical protein